MDGKLNDLKTDARASRVERLELLTKIKDVATNSHPDSTRHLIKESIELKMRKQEPIIHLATVTIKYVKYEVYALKIIFSTLKMKVNNNIHESLSDADSTSLHQLTDPKDYCWVRILLMFGKI